MRKQSEHQSVSSRFEVGLFSLWGRKRTERIVSAKSIGELVDMMNEKELGNFLALIVYHQVHNENDYLLDEVGKRHQLFDVAMHALSKRGRLEGLRKAKTTITSSIEESIYPDAYPYVMRLGRAALEKRSVLELNEIAKSYGEDSMRE